MNRILLTLLILSCTLQTVAQEYGIAIPVSQDPKTNEWYILLGLHQDNQWWPFREQLQPGEKANVAAQRGLSNKTNNVYNISITGVPWQKVGNTFYHFVPVNFISGTTLYNTATNNAVSDFVWVPAKELLQAGPIKPHKKKTTTVVGESFANAYKSLWPTMEAKLAAPQQTGSAPVMGTVTKTPLGATTKIMGSPGTQWGGNPDAIYFYAKDEPYYEFTNFWEQNVTIDGKVWPTTEQYYQAQKFTDGKLQDTIRQFKTPRQAFEFAKQHKISVRSDWQKISLDTMRKAVRAKFTQHKGLAKLLLATNNKILVEAAGKNDDFYGAGADYNGQNWLGRILMEVRSELQQAIQSKIAPQGAQPIAQPSSPSLIPLTQSLNTLRNSLNTLEATLSSSPQKIATSNTPSQAAKRENFDPFAHVVGMPEKDFITLNAAQKQAMVKGNTLVNKQTGQPWHMGTVKIASVDALRKTKKDGKGSVFNVIEGVDTPWNNWFREHLDVTALQAAPENKDAVFQVASNFNGLEGSGDPHAGIMPYLSPDLYVQGEAAALSAMPGIIYRMYYMPHIVNGTTYYGQLEEQLNLLEQFNTGAYIIPVYNGYIGNPKLNDFSQLSDTELKKLAGNVNIAFHGGISVSGGLGPLKNELPNYIAVKVTDPSQRINQIFAAALNPYGGKEGSKGFKELAQMLLYAAYEGALKSTYAHGKKKVFLTLIGGGVFKNDLAWITKAIEHAVTPFLTYGNLEINLIVYYSGDYKKKNIATWNNFEAKMNALVQKSGGQYVQYHTAGKQIK